MEYWQRRNLRNSGAAGWRRCVGAGADLRPASVSGGCLWRNSSYKFFLDRVWWLIVANAGRINRSFISRNDNRRARITEKLLLNLHFWFRNVGRSHLLLLRVRILRRGFGDLSCRKPVEELAPEFLSGNDLPSGALSVSEFRYGQLVVPLTQLTKESDEREG